MHQILLWHYFVVVLLAAALHLFVEILQILVRLLTEQVEILRTCLDNAVFLNQSCQVTDLVQLFFDFVVAVPSSWCS